MAKTRRRRRRAATGRRKSYRRRNPKRKGARRRRRSYGTVTLNRRGRKSKRRRFVVSRRNPGSARSAAWKLRLGRASGLYGASSGGSGTAIVSGVKPKRRRRRRLVSGKKRSHGRRRGYRRRRRPYTGRIAHVTLRRGRRIPRARRRKILSHGFRLNNPGKKRRRRRRRGVGTLTLSRKARRGRRRKFALRNPKRRRHGKRRRNPGGVAGFFEAAKGVVFSGKFWLSSGEVALGISAATVLPALAESASKGKLENAGATGVALSAVASGVAFGAAYFVEDLLSEGTEKHWAVQGLAKYVGLGAGAATVIRGIFAFAPKLAEWLKLSPVRTPVVYFPGMRPAPAPMPAAAAGAHGMGFYGMGAVDAGAANEALIAGESFARSVSQFEGMGDWLELKGMGDWLELKGMGGYRLPMQNIRTPGQLSGGYPGQYGGGSYDPYHSRRFSGMGDMLETGPGDVAPEQWEPAMETF